MAFGSPAPKTRHDQKVIVAFPHPPEVSARFMRSMLFLFQYDAVGAVDGSGVRHGGRQRIVDGGGLIAMSSSAVVARARNRIVREFLKTEADWLLQVDTDMTFEPSLVEDLVAAAHPTLRPIVGGLCFAYMADKQRKLWPTMYAYVPGSERLRRLTTYPADTLVPVAATGAACLLTHRSVLEAMQARFPPPRPWFDETKFYDRDADGRIIPETGDEYSEDLTFPVDPSTAVLGADWRWRPISEFVPGDEVMGIDEHSPPHSSRRFRRALVERVIEKRLPRLRIITDDEEIITTAEHPWLTKRWDDDGGGSWCWRWTAAGSLRVGKPLASVVQRVENPDMRSDDYAAGYVQGLLQSDGTRDPSGSFVVRMKDTEPLERVATMLAQIGVASRRGPAYWDGDERHAPMHRLGVYERSSRELVEPIWQMTHFPSKGFAAGYLAGMFDGDGSHFGGRLQIHSVRDGRKDRLEDAARLIGVPFSGRGPRSVWLDSQDAIFRFWQSTLPSLSRRTAPIGQPSNIDGVRGGMEVKHRTSTIRAIEELPPADVVCLQTTTSTFIADGLASHNCLRAQACGFPIHVHTGIRLGHEKSFLADEAGFLTESALLADHVRPALPTFAVVASRNRPEMLATLRSQLSGQASEVFVYDNGYPEAPEGSIPAHDWPLHRMWNDGLDRARRAAAGSPFNALVLNDDVQVPNELAAKLEAALRCDDDNWVAYPDMAGRLENDEVAQMENPSMAGQTLTGYAMMLRGEAGLRFDEEFQFWYGDSDLEKRVRAAGKRVVAVGGAVVEHLDPMRSTLENPERLAQAIEDERLFAKKWNLDPETLWLHVNGHVSMAAVE